MERHVCPLNHDFGNLKNLIFCDVTLREGEQTPGVSFTFDEKIELIRRLDAFGVHQIQIAHPKFDERILEFCARVCAMPTKCKKEIMSHGGWDKCIDAIDRLVECNPDIVHSYFPVSPYILDNWNDNSPEWIRQRIQLVTSHIKHYDKIASISLLDSTRADPELVVSFAKAAAEAGADRIRIPDTVGVATPDSMYELVSKVVEAVEPYNTIVGIHTHNDFGLALANTLAGIRAGAKLADASVNGLGDRAGNVSLVELAAALEVLYGASTGLQINQTMELSKYGEKISGVKIPTNKPIIGENVFTDQTELHFLAQSHQKYALQGVDPEIFGAHRSFLYGKLTSDRIIALTAEKAGVQIDPSFYPAIRDALYEAAESCKGRTIHESDFWQIVNTVIKK